MSWSDDDFDADAAIAQKEKVAATKKDDSEDSSDEEPAAKPEPKLAAPKPKSKGKDVKKKSEIPEDQKALSDPKKERERLKKLQEAQDARNTADLFGGIDSDKEEEEETKVDTKFEAKTKVVIVENDLFDKLELKTQADVEGLAGKCMEKINGGKAKGAQQMFLTNLLKSIGDHLELKDLEALQKQMAEVLKMKKVEKTAVDTGKRKTNEVPKKNTKFNIHAETAVVYGDGDYEEWDDEDWAAWETGEKAAPKAAASGAKW